MLVNTERKWRVRDDVDCFGGIGSIEWEVEFHFEEEHYGAFGQQVPVIDSIELYAFEWSDDYGFWIRWEADQIAKWSQEQINRILGLVHRDDLEDVG